MLQLGRKLKQGLFVIMATLTLPSAHSMNAVYPINIPTATSSEYYTKTVNLKESAGSFLAEATMLVYDEILRYQRGVEFTHGLDENQLAKFDYDAFEANVKWFMDEIVGIESEWKKDALNPESGAYGYVQFLNQASVQTAVNRYRYHIEKFNTRRSGAGYTRTQAVNEWFPPIKTDTYDLYISDIPDVKALPATNFSMSPDLAVGEVAITSASKLATSRHKGIDTEKFYDYSFIKDSTGITASWTMSNTTYGTSPGSFEAEEYFFFGINLTEQQAGQIQYAYENENWDDFEKLGFVYSFFDPSVDYTRDDRWEGSNYDDSLVKLVGGKWTYPAYTKTVSVEASGILPAETEIISFPAKTLLTASGKRDWNPRGYSDGSRMEYPEWLITLERKVNGDLIGTIMDPGDYDHQADLSLLNYDEMVALAFVHMHSKTSKDFNFVQLAKGDVTAAKELYKNNHHMASGGIQVKNILETLSAKQKNSIYFAIKRIYEPMYGKGTNSTILDDETYFNYLKGYVGSFFYKEYDWWNTDDDLGWGEFILINGGNALYQVFDMIFEGESITEAFKDLIQQGKGTFDAALNKSDIRDELKGKTIKLQLYNDNMSEGPIVWVGFDKNGNVVVWEKKEGAGTEITDTDIATQARIDKFFKIH